MCSVSVISDDFLRRSPNILPQISQWQSGTFGGPTRAEFEALRNEVSELKELLKAAKRYDEATGQADCEQEDKIALLRKIADLVGVDLDEVFPRSPT